jgi:hypothetical protein
MSLFKSRPYDRQRSLEQVARAQTCTGRTGAKHLTLGQRPIMRKLALPRKTPDPAKEHTGRYMTCVQSHLES